MKESKQIHNELPYRSKTASVAMSLLSETEILLKVYKHVYDEIKIILASVSSAVKNPDFFPGSS